MIKFYQGKWEAISGKVNSQNNIVFVTDRQVLMMGGKEYGKDGGAIKIEAGSGYTSGGVIADLGSRDVADGTLFYFKGDQSLLKYVSGTAWEPVQTPTLSAADLISSNADASGSIVFTTRGNSDTYKATTADIASAVTTLEDKVEAAYSNNGNTIAYDAQQPNALDSNKIVVSKENGIGKTNYILDYGQIATEVLSAAAASEKSAALDTTLVNGRTAAKIVEQVSKNKTTIVDSVGSGSGFVTWTSSDSVASGTVWTPEFHVLTGNVSGSLKNNNGVLENHIAIRKVETTEGYLASYALFNENSAVSGLQLGDTINLVKDQFLKGAAYVKAIEGTGTGATGGYIDYTQDNYNNNKTLFCQAVGAPETTDYSVFNTEYANKLARYLKLTFVLTKQEDAETATDNDDYIYINVNELFDSYTGINGVFVNQDTNQISAVVATSAQNNEVRKTAANGTYLNNSANGLYVTGINDDIKAYIQDLGHVQTSGVNTWLTEVGVQADGTLSSACLSAYASGVNFNTIGAVTGNSTDARVAVTGVTVQDAFNSISNTIAKLDYSYNGSKSTATTPDRAEGDNRTYFIYDITQTDGQIETHAKPLDGGELQATSKAGAKLSTILLTVNEAGAVTSTKQAEDGQVYAISTTAGETGSLQTAIDTIVTSVASTFADLNMTQVGAGIDTTNAKKSPNTATGSEDYDTFKIVNTIVQNNGYVNATQLDLIAQNVGFEPIVSSATHIPVAGYSVGKALSSISQYIGNLDFTTDTAGTAPAAGTDNKYSIVNTVAQENGLVSDTKIDLTAANTHQAGIVEALTSNTAAADARVGITKGTVQEALDRISNILGDYLSFHDKDDKLITSAN